MSGNNFENLEIFIEKVCTIEYSMFYEKYVFPILKFCCSKKSLLKKNINGIVFFENCAFFSNIR